MNLQTSDFDYHLPPELIAQTPSPKREESRLLVVHRSSGALEDTLFSAIGQYLQPGDVLVANRSRVIPARIRAVKSTGGEAEVFLLRPLDVARWIALARPGRRLRPGTVLHVPGSPLTIELMERLAEGQWVVCFSGTEDLEAAVRCAGTVPLPPYIRSGPDDPERYQTVYADRDGSVAAPTAGLHFSGALLDRIRGQGVDVQFVTLHVGLGTFRPVAVDDPTKHVMHAEWGEVPPDVAAAVNAAREAGGRVIAVGTTTTRLLESAVEDGQVVPFRGETDRFIFPGYTFRAIDALVTNFHLPKSTLLMLVSALAGRDLIMDAYRHAIAARYRFYSFGDAMLILP